MLNAPHDESKTKEKHAGVLVNTNRAQNRKHNI